MKAALKKLSIVPNKAPERDAESPVALTKAEQLALQRRIGSRVWEQLTARQRKGLDPLPPPPRLWPTHFSPLSGAQAAEGWVRVSPTGESEAPLPEIEVSNAQPHEFLGHIAQGKPVYQWVLKQLKSQQGVVIATKYVEECVLPDFSTRVDAAKAAAPYYAARLSKTDLKAVVSLEDLINKSLEAAE